MEVMEKSHVVYILYTGLIVMGIFSLLFLLQALFFFIKQRKEAKLFWKQLNDKIEKQNAEKMDKIKEALNNPLVTKKIAELFKKYYDEKQSRKTENN